jgi:hypothetical protein
MSAKAGSVRKNGAVPILRGALAIEGLPKDDREWATRWYLGIVRNPPGLSEPGVRLLLTQPPNSGENQRWKCATIGLTHLGQVRLSSIWKNGVLLRDHPMTPLTVKVSGSPESFALEPAIAVRRLSRLSPTFQEGQLLELPSILKVSCPNRDIRLLIPTIELFSRCYGRSQQLKRVLATLPFSDAVRELIAPDCVPQKSGYWLITLAKNIPDEDELFLSHLKHDDTTGKRVRRLCGSFQSASVQGGAALVTPEVLPWWSGNVLLSCLGINLTNDPGTFLVFRIDGMENPHGPPLQSDRENTNRVESTDEPHENASSSGWPRHRKAHQKNGDPSELVHTQEPSRMCKSRVVYDDPFSILGTPRHIERVERARSHSYAPPSQGVEEGPRALSGGAHRSLSGCDQPGPASITAPRLVESPDEVMKAVWAALIAIASTTGTTSIAIQIWTGTTFRSSADVVPIGEPFVAPDVRDAQPWCYVRDPAEPKRRSRRYYLVKAVAKSVTGYLFELERRVAQSDQRPLTETERFRGLAFTLDGSVGIQDLITTICARATESKGVLADSVTLHGFRKALLYNIRRRFARLRDAD